MGNGEPGIARKADPPVAPVSAGQPFDEVIAVLPVLGSPVMNVPLRTEGPACVRIDNGIAVTAPVCRVRAFPDLQVGQRTHGNAHPAGNLVEGLVAALLPVGAPGNNGWNLLGTDRAKNIDVDGDAVPHGHGDVPFENNVAGEGRAPFLWTEPFSRVVVPGLNPG